MVERGLMEYPLETTLPLISGKWKFYILCSLIGCPKHFGELRRSIGNVSQKVLTENLRSMEKDGLLTRVIHKNEPQVMYKLTKVGDSVCPVIHELVQWSSKYETYLAANG